MKNIKLIIENQDVLTEELSNIFGGQTDESTPIVVHCNSDGVVQIPPSKNEMTVL